MYKTAMPLSYLQIFFLKIQIFVEFFYHKRNNFEG